jgi:hypothetical protein
MQVWYFTIEQMTNGGFIKWDKLKVQRIVEKGRFVSHIRFDKPLDIRMDGKKGMAVILNEQNK